MSTTGGAGVGNASSSSAGERITVGGGSGAAAAAGTAVGADSASSRAARAFPTSSRTSPCSAWESNGFVTIASLPTSSARFRSNGSKVPVRRTTGTNAPPGRFFTASQTS